MFEISLQQSKVKEPNVCNYIEEISLDLRNVR